MNSDRQSSVITLRISSELNQDLERYADQTNRTKTEVVLESLSNFLDEKSARKYPESRTDAMRETDWGNFKPIYSLSDDERRKLILLEQIAKKLEQIAKNNPDPKHEEEEHERAIVALSRGYTSEYDEVLPGIFPELPNEASNEAQDIMEMFQTLLLGYEGLSTEDKKTIGKENESFIHCHGFDFNDPLEGRLYKYLKFIYDDNRWVKPYDDMMKHSDGGNSHSPYLGFYRSMLTRYKRIQRRHQSTLTPLSAKEINEIIKPHSNR